MSKKYIIMRKVTIPLLTLLMAFPTTALAIPSDKILDAINTDQQIELTLPQTTLNTNINETKLVASRAADNPEIKAFLDKQNEGKVKAEDAGYIPTYSLTDFSKLRTSLEKLFPTTVQSDKSKTGELYTAYGIAAGDKIGSTIKGGTTADYASKDPSYFGVMQRPSFQKQLKDPAIQAELSKIADNSFSDVNSSFWGSRFIPLAVYYGVIKGDAGEGGTFRPNDPVKRSEWSMMLATAYYGRQTVLQKNSGMTYKAIKNKDGNAWYAGSWQLVQEGLPSAFSSPKEEFSANMTRYELALSICETVFTNEFGEFEKKDPHSVNNPFKDLKEAPRLGLSDEDAEYMLKTINASKSNPSAGVPDFGYKAILYLNSKGIMNGNGDGTVSPFKNVTRAEALVMLQEAARVNGEQLGK